MKKTYILAVAVLITTFSYAGGYRVALQGQKQLAMGHAGVAVINSAESVFFNPGGIAFLDKKITISVGVSPVFANISFQNSEFGWSTEADNPVATPFNVYAAYKINDWMSAGIGVYTPYGSGVEYPGDWEGSHLVNKIELSSIYIQPTFSFKINDKLSIGGGPIIAIGSVNFNRNINRSMSNAAGERANVTIDDSGVTAWGYSLGMAFRPTDKLTLGLTYKSEMKMKAKNGEAEFRNLPGTAPGNFDNVTFNATLPLPAELAVGASYMINDKWLVAFDYNRVYWDAYESLDVYFSNGQASHNPRNYKNSSVYRFGLQYIASGRFTLRGGYYYDESPVQAGYFAPETPRNDSNNFTGGLTFNISERFAIDAAFLFVHFDEVDASYDHYQENGQNVSFGGTYKNNAFVPSLGVSYAF
ncbi:OmpP1/FadL family transporter [Sinomicrobium weinanense]|uniref:Outer membrane protein transport protein n=1 Tax=Sinomicrobium weinanense TaxID=2842200 RepID=A0A926JVH7_9FLAO|nr:outer membrane protein transport protein [Sinomicrobium weinanense]MBC9797958.1 outer membrane protein transport protein [Sinomicrobium weinanense]MBU3123106.1 outer membrane protein transport protein [Sinomicrobium weinanense]